MLVVLPPSDTPTIYHVLIASFAVLQECSRLRGGKWTGMGWASGKRMRGGIDRAKNGLWGGSTSVGIPGMGQSPPRKLQIWVTPCWTRGNDPCQTTPIYTLYTSLIRRSNGIITRSAWLTARARTFGFDYSKPEANPARKYWSSFGAKSTKLIMLRRVAWGFPTENSFEKVKSGGWQLLSKLAKVLIKVDIKREQTCSNHIHSSFYTIHIF